MWREEGDRVQNENDHLVPLNALSCEVLANMAAGPIPPDKVKAWPRKGLVFTTTGTTPISGLSKVKAKLDREMLPILQKIADRRADALGEPRELAFLPPRSEEHTSELQSLMRTSYAVFCLKKNN